MTPRKQRAGFALLIRLLLFVPADLTCIALISPLAGQSNGATGLVVGLNGEWRISEASAGTDTSGPSLHAFDRIRGGAMLRLLSDTGAISVALTDKTTLRRSCAKPCLVLIPEVQSIPFFARLLFALEQIVAGRTGSERVAAAGLLRTPTRPPVDELLVGWPQGRAIRVALPSYGREDLLSTLLLAGTVLRPMTVLHCPEGGRDCGTPICLEPSGVSGVGVSDTIGVGMYELRKSAGGCTRDGTATSNPGSPQAGLGSRRRTYLYLAADSAAAVANREDLLAVLRWAPGSTSLLGLLPGGLAAPAAQLMCQSLQSVAEAVLCP